MNAPEVVPCVGALVYDDAGRLLMIKRGREPALGLWSLPGGRVDVGESMPEALVREVVEETGLVVTPGRVVGSVNRDGPHGAIYAITDMVAVWTGGTLRAGDDAQDARFVDVAELSSLALSPGLVEALREWDALPGPLHAQPPPSDPESSGV